MSLVLITQHDECIYDVTRKPESSQEMKGMLYRSKHARRVRRDAKARGEMATMGPSRVPAPNPKEFLRKRSGKQSVVCSKPVNSNGEKDKTVSAIKMPAIPLKDEVLKEQDEKLRHTKKNMIRINIENAEQMKPREPCKKVIDDRLGTTRKLHAGLQPVHIYSKGFGKIPPYLETLIKRKEKMHQLKQETETKVDSKCRYITREEREKLLTGLKQNWQELQSRYQGLPILTDTIPKKIRKSKLEADLKQLEKDIVLVERHPYIYVFDDEIQNHET